MAEEEASKWKSSFEFNVLRHQRLAAQRSFAELISADRPCCEAAATSTKSTATTTSTSTGTAAVATTSSTTTVTVHRKPQKFS